jgi:hypothetical protein
MCVFLSSPNKNSRFKVIVEDEEAAKGVAANLVQSSRFDDLLQFVQQNINSGAVPAPLSRLVFYLAFADLLTPSAARHLSRYCACISRLLLFFFCLAPPTLPRYTCAFNSSSSARLG